MAKLTPDQQAYVDKHQCEQLTVVGNNDLYRTCYGARTIADALEMEVLASAYWRKQAAIVPGYDPWDKADPRLYARHEKSTDLYGVSPYC